MKLSRRWLHEEYADLSAHTDREFLQALDMEPVAKEQVDGDTVLHFDLAALRPDCASVIGLAREAAAAFGMTRKHHEPAVLGCADDSIYDHLDVDVYADELCRRCTVRMVKNLKPGPSPDWLRRRLLACGVTPVNSITDIASYVMLEYGQPIHIFDLRRITSGSLTIREAYGFETLTTPEGDPFTPDPGAPVIADGDEAISLAGFFDCGETAIGDDAEAVLLLAASFDADSIRQTAQSLGLDTPASRRFALELDPMLTMPAVQRACELVELLQIGDVPDGVIDILNYVPQPRELPLEPDRINAILGADLSEAELLRFLALLEIPAADGVIRIPSRRPDLQDTADIAREIARLRSRCREMKD